MDKVTFTVHGDLSRTEARHVGGGRAVRGLSVVQ
jgi:hypothetical protein